MKAFEELFGEYAPVVYRFLLAQCGNGELAEELTAETFYQAYLHIGSFRGDCQPQTWLCKIARNALIKEQKRRQRHLPLETQEGADAGADLAERLNDREQAMEIHKQLHKLKEPYREVFMLRVLGQLSFKEIAAVCERTESWAKVTYYRAKEKLIAEMEVHNEDKL